MLQVKATPVHWKVIPPLVGHGSWSKMNSADTLQHGEPVNFKQSFATKSYKGFGITILRQCLLHAIHKLRESVQ